MLVVEDWSSLDSQNRPLKAVAVSPVEAMASSEPHMLFGMAMDAVVLLRLDSASSLDEDCSVGIVRQLPWLEDWVSLCTEGSLPQWTGHVTYLEYEETYAQGVRKYQPKIRQF